mmetsp:Transcript_27743/g.69672  ORF Transcript_27743/g.69672 Transcript_27743/m.69672 type:complete len:113 (+) Transcript_27743:1335-1673(+)
MRVGTRKPAVGGGFDSDPGSTDAGGGGGAAAGGVAAADGQKLGAAAAAAAAAGCEGPESCSICLAAYSIGEQLRVLRCGHYFHRNCVDTWLLKHRSSCPLCLFSVGPAAATG